MISIRNRGLAVIGAAFALAATSMRAQTDPYAAGQAALDQHGLEDSINIAKSLYFAFGCRVVPLEVQIRVVIGAETNSLINTVIPYDKLMMRLRAAKQAGLGEAALGCDYWKEHPETVRYVRQLVNIYTGAAAFP